MLFSKKEKKKSRKGTWQLALEIKKSSEKKRKNTVEN